VSSSSLKVSRRAPLATRRELLAGALAMSSACRSSTKAPPPEAQASATSSEATSALPPLEVVQRGDLSESERGGTAVVLLHGWGAPGDDLVSLAQRLTRPKSRFFVPAAPLAHGGGGRAWWEISESNRPAHAWDDTLPPEHRPNAQVSMARRLVQDLLRNIRDRYAPERLVVAGFSQGAMLSLDLALTADPPIDRAAALSGVLLVDSLPALLAARSTRPSFFMSHGKADAMLRFGAGERASQLLTKHGFSVTFHPFDGGHEIPGEVVSALRQYIFEA